MRKISMAIVAAVVATTMVGCTFAGPAVPVRPSPTTTTLPPRADYRVMGGLEQLYVVGGLEGDRIRVSLDGDTVATGTIDRLGSLAVRELIQGRTYVVTNETSGDTRDVTILRTEDHPPQEFYAATRLREGLNYIPMRDGITLAATVRPPLGLSLADGPFPTVVEYSGYQIAAPGEPFVDKVAQLLGLPPDPTAPGGETAVGSMLMRLAGFAVVSVQLRGSGCSGGEGDLFDLPSTYDGYDIIETVGNQRWVTGGRVGMVGISFSGYSQLAVAATDPPHLAAIAPMSFLGSMYDIAHPGGIFNDGFARTWIAERVRNARPAPDPGALPYANELVKVDPQCRDNQRLRLQTRDADTLIRSNDTFGREYERRDFREMMKRVQVPTYAFLQFEDEQVSSYVINSAPDLLGANDKVWMTLSNGQHNDAVSPQSMTQLFEFLDIYVAGRPPEAKLLVQLLNPIVFGEGSASLSLPARFGAPLSQARAEFEARPRVRLLLEMPRGAYSGSQPGARWDVSVPTYPVPGSVERTWYLGDGGTLASAPGPDATAQYRPDPAARREVRNGSEPGSTVWEPVADGNGLAFLSAPLTEGLVLLGPAAASIALSSSAPDTDLGLTLGEVRPDGTEIRISTGTQRGSMRDVDPNRSTATLPAFTFTQRRPLLPGINRVPVQILPTAHVVRAGSRLRLTVAGVGGDREAWRYDSIDPEGGTTLNTLHLGASAPSSITLTAAPLSGYPAGALPCPSAGKPCRAFVPMANGG
jgi:predicted acyl esterase